MTDHMQTIKDDLAYLRALAEEGRAGGERGGAIILAAGLIYAVCSMLQWAALTDRISQTVSGAAWLIGTVLFFLVMWLIKVRGGGSTGRSKVAGIAWTSVGWSILTLFVVLAVATWRTQSILLVYLAPSIIFALYGAAWMVAGAISGKGWVKLTAVGSYVAAVACAFVITEPLQYLIYAAGLLLLAAAPGFVLMRQESGRA